MNSSKSNPISPHSDTLNWMENAMIALEKSLHLKDSEWTWSAFLQLKKSFAELKDKMDES